MGVLSVMHVQSHWNTEKSLNLNVALQTPSCVLWMQIYIILRLFSKSYCSLENTHTIVIRDTQKFLHNDSSFIVLAKSEFLNLIFVKLTCYSFTPVDFL